MLPDRVIRATHGLAVSEGTLCLLTALPHLQPQGHCLALQKEPDGDQDVPSAHTPSSIPSLLLQVHPTSPVLLALHPVLSLEVAGKIAPSWFWQR